MHLKKSVSRYLTSYERVMIDLIVFPVVIKGGQVDYPHEKHKSQCVRSGMVAKALAVPLFSCSS